MKANNKINKLNRKKEHIAWDKKTKLYKLNESDLWKKQMKNRHIIMQHIILALWTCSTSYNHQLTLINMNQIKRINQKIF